MQKYTKYLIEPNIYVKKKFIKCIRRLRTETKTLDYTFYLRCSSYASPLHLPTTLDDNTIIIPLTMVI